MWKIFNRSVWKSQILNWRRKQMRNNLISNIGESRVNASVFIKKEWRKERQKLRGFRKLRYDRSLSASTPLSTLPLGPVFSEGPWRLAYVTDTGLSQPGYNGSPQGLHHKWDLSACVASWLLSLGSFSHWLLRWRLLLFGEGIDTSSLKGIWSFHGTETIKHVQWGSSKLFRESQIRGSTWSPQVLQYEQAFKNFHKSKGSAQCERNGGNKRNRKLEEDGHAQEGTLVNYGQYLPTSKEPAYVKQTLVIKCKGKMGFPHVVA